MRILFWAMVATEALVFSQCGRRVPDCGARAQKGRICFKKRRRARGATPPISYLMTSVTTPEPTVRPPSRIANRRPCVHGDRLDQLDLHLDVVARHDHLGALGQVGHAGDVGRAEVELRPVAREERRVTAALLLLEDVDLGLELGVRRDRARACTAPGRARSPRAWCRAAGSRRCRRRDPRRGSS